MIDDFTRRLDAGEVILIDGGTGTELEARGVPMNGAVWCGVAVLDHQDVVRGVHEDYIRAAVARGISPARVATRHALRNALMPAVTVLGYTLGDLLGGAVVVETVFAWPGVGSLAAQGILNNDSILVVGFTLFVAAMMVVVNLLVDVLYAVVDPRVRY